MIVVDLNVLLDVVQKREPHYRASATVLEYVVQGDIRGAVAAHGATTLHYLVAKYRDGAAADRLIDWLLRYFEVLPVGEREIVRARGLGWGDFEDAVVAAAAELSGSSAILTRNVRDFRTSPVQALTPEEYLVGAGNEEQL